MVNWLKNEMKISELSSDVQVDFKDCLFHESIIKGERKYLNLKKWIRYSAVDYGDADRVLKTAENRKVLSDKLGWDNCKYIDCIFSFKTFFNAFLRLYFQGAIPYYGELMDSFDDFFCDTKLNEFQNKYKLSKKELCEFFFQLNEFAMRTHTIGNYMPCPDNTYNGKKGGGDGYVYFQDRIELIIDAIENKKYVDYLGRKTIYRWRVWFNSKKKEYILDEIVQKKDELMKFVCPFVKKGRFTIFVMQDKENIIEYTKYLEAVNVLISNRTYQMVEKMKTYE